MLIPAEKQVQKSKKNLRKQKKLLTKKIFPLQYVYKIGELFLLKNLGG